jgi:hypothetical protein
MKWAMNSKPTATLKVLTLAAFGLALSCLVSGCATTQRERPLAIASRVVDCEWKAVSRYDDGNSTVSQLAQRVMGICAVERMKARKAFGLPSNEVELGEYREAVENVEAARKANARIRQ